MGEGRLGYYGAQDLAKWNTDMGTHSGFRGRDRTLQEYGNNQCFGRARRILLDRTLKEYGNNQCWGRDIARMGWGGYIGLRVHL